MACCIIWYIVYTIYIYIYVHLRILQTMVSEFHPGLCGPYSISTLDPSQNRPDGLHPLISSPCLLGRPNCASEAKPAKLTNGYRDRLVVHTHLYPRAPNSRSYLYTLRPKAGIIYLLGAIRIPRPHQPGINPVETHLSPGFLACDRVALAGSHGSSLENVRALQTWKIEPPVCGCACPSLRVQSTQT